MLQEEINVSIMLQEETETYTMLQEESKFFSDNRERLIDRYIGKLLSIKGSRLVGVFEAQRAASREGTMMFGVEPFLIQRVGQDFRSFNAAPPDTCACAPCSGVRLEPLFQACA